MEWMKNALTSPTTFAIEKHNLHFKIVVINRCEMIAASIEDI